MRVGLLTYHWVSNFGANLQTLSTYCYLKRNGYDPIIINWIPTDLESYYAKTVLSEQNIVHQQFAENEYSSKTVVCRNSKEIASAIKTENIDKVVIGSDAVFTITPFLSRLHLCKRGVIFSKCYSDSTIINPFWGDFLLYLEKKVDVVAISASAQNTQYKKLLGWEKRKCALALNNFKTITVRDIWTQEMLIYISNGMLKPEITPDPVFAFEQNVRPPQRSYIRKELGITNDYVLLSVPATIKDESWIHKLEALFNERGYSVVGLPITTRNKNMPLTYNISLPLYPLDWYDIIKFSSGYIGELMHPILVSLHNAVPVFAFDTYGFKIKGELDPKSSKTFQILKHFNLLKNYYNKSYNDLPSPHYVVDTILSCDRSKISNVSSFLYEEYDSTMKKLLEL